MCPPSQLCRTTQRVAQSEFVPRRVRTSRDSNSTVLATCIAHPLGGWSICATLSSSIGARQMGPAWASELTRD